MVNLLPPFFRVHPVSTTLTTVDSNATAVYCNNNSFVPTLQTEKVVDEDEERNRVLYSFHHCEQMSPVSYRQQTLRKKNNKNNNIIPPTAVATQMNHRTN
mmetsp:Transcript_28377/g.32191  ORF Transcript_28377/g.32191 Transcript_28377/m.32191 type:complete len:100 (-) Transcript_28377:40-339(-)